MIQNCKRVDMFFDTENNYWVREFETTWKIGSESLWKRLRPVNYDSLDPSDQDDEDSFYDLMKKIFKINPQERISIEDAMKHKWIVSIIRNLKQI